MSNIIVLGAGMVGSAMAIDLVKQHEVTLTDVSQDVLNKVKNKEAKLTIVQLDVTDKAKLQEMVKPFDLVVNAVPGFLGFETLKRCIEVEKNVIDIAFFPEDALELDALAKEKGVTAIMDIGVAPGMDNIMKQ